MNDLAKLDLVELLDRMADIHTPQPVSYWPQTAGWLAIGIALGAIAALIGWRWFKLRRGNLYRRQALRELDAIAARPSDAVVQLAAAAGILRRVALVGFPRRSVAALCGQDWLTFLDNTGADVRFGGGPGRHLAAAPYVKQCDVSVQELQAALDLAAKWIVSHHREDGRA